MVEDLKFGRVAMKDPKLPVLQYIFPSYRISSSPGTGDGTCIRASVRDTRMITGLSCLLSHPFDREKSKGWGTGFFLRFTRRKVLMAVRRNGCGARGACRRQSAG